MQAAINAARSQLPANLPSNPSYKKVNPADAPILILALTSNTLRRGLIYDAASSILAQKLSQIGGVGQVTVGGSALPGVRVELNLNALNNYGIGLEQIRNTLNKANANRPKGEVADQTNAWAISATDQLLKRGPVQPADRRLQQWRRRPSFRRRRRHRFGRRRAQRRDGRRHARRS